MSLVYLALTLTALTFVNYEQKGPTIMALPQILAVKFPELAAHWSTCAPLFHQQTLPAHTTLLAQGEVADNIYIVLQGALHLYHETDNRTIAVQFFLENQIVSSFESFYAQVPSDCTLATLENSSLLQLHRADFNRLCQQYPTLEQTMTRWICQRFMLYRQRVILQLQNTPTQRYQELVANEPELLDRVPLHELASYLGITPVSLSRIRHKLAKK